jgi:hypothetical protein
MSSTHIHKPTTLIVIVPNEKNDEGSGGGGEGESNDVVDDGEPAKAVPLDPAMQLSVDWIVQQLLQSEDEDDGEEAEGHQEAAGALQAGEEADGQQETLRVQGPEEQLGQHALSPDDSPRRLPGGQVAEEQEKRPPTEKEGGAERAPPPPPWINWWRRLTTEKLRMGPKFTICAVR